MSFPSERSCVYVSADIFVASTYGISMSPTRKIIDYLIIAGIIYNHKLCYDGTYVMRLLIFLDFGLSGLNFRDPVKVYFYDFQV